MQLDLAIDFGDQTLQSLGLDLDLARFMVLVGYSLPFVVIWGSCLCSVSNLVYLELDRYRDLNNLLKQNLLSELDPDYFLT